MKKMTQGVSTLHIVLCVWLVFSAIYIVHDLWKNGLSATYQSGYQRAFADVIGQSQQCQPFNVFVGDAKVDLINVACLQQQGGEETAQEGEGAPAGAAPADVVPPAPVQVPEA